jgi:hypothetical protein
MKRSVALMASFVLLVFLAAGCKGSATNAASSSPSAAATAAATSCPSKATGFAKTKFIAHAGLGFGAFHRYIYKPYRAGTFRSGAHGRLTAFIKAGLAALFIKREIRLAGLAAQKSPALCKLILTPLRKVSETVQDAVTKLKGGDTSGITSVQGAISQVKSNAASQGTTITENPNAPLS